MPGHGRERAAEDGPDARALRGAPARLRADRGAARVPARDRRGPRRPGRRRSQRLRAADPRLAIMFEPMLGVTFTPTRISASEKINVIPSRAELKVDCRVPPGLGEEEVREGIAEVLGSDEASRRGSSSSPSASSATARRCDSQLMDTIVDVDRRAATRARSSCRWCCPASPTRATSASAFPECVAYGFFPQRHQSLLRERAPDPRRGRAHRRARPARSRRELFRDLAVRAARLTPARLYRLRPCSARQAPREPA